jgi:hypothetical protein
LGFWAFGILGIWYFGHLVFWVCAKNWAIIFKKLDCLKSIQQWRRRSNSGEDGNGGQYEEEGDYFPSLYETEQDQPAQTSYILAQSVPQWFDQVHRPNWFQSLIAYLLRNCQLHCSNFQQICAKNLSPPLVLMFFSAVLNNLAMVHWLPDSMYSNDTQMER